VTVIGGFDRQTDNALREPLDVDPGGGDGEGILFLLLFFARFVSGRGRRALADLDLVAFRLKGGFRIAGQGHHVDARHVAIDVVPFGLAVEGIKIAVGDEKEVAVVAAEDRIGAVKPAVADRGCGFGGHRIEVEARHHLLFAAGVDDPLVVGRPGIVVEFKDPGAVDEGDLPGFNIDILQAQLFVRPEQLAAVR